MRILKWIGLIGAIVALVSVGWIKRYSPLSHLKCLSSKGYYRLISRRPFESRAFTCVHYFSDGGNSCANSDQCQGNCLVGPNTKLTQSGYTAKYVSGEGICENNDLPHSCYSGTIENPHPEICYWTCKSEPSHVLFKLSLQVPVPFGLEVGTLQVSSYLQSVLWKTSLQISILLSSLGLLFY